MYGMYYDLPLDYTDLIFDEMVNAVKAKVKEQTGTSRKEGKNPKNLSYPRFFSVLLGNVFFGETTIKGQPFPKDGLPTKINKMKSHSPTIHSKGYAVRRPLSYGFFEYLSEDRKQEYIRGYRTPELELVTPPHIGVQIGQIVVYLREEREEGVQVGVEEKVAQERKETKKKREKRV